MDKIAYIVGKTPHDFTWKGKYTHGLSSIKGTCVWLTEESGIRYYSHDSCQWQYPQTSQLNKMKEIHAFEIFKNKNRIDNHENEIINESSLVWDLTDTCIRADKPSQCINELFELITYEQLQSFVKNSSEYLSLPQLSDLQKFKSLLLENGNYQTVWYGMYDLESTKQELIEIEKLAESLGIQFVWN